MTKVCMYSLFAGYVSASCGTHRLPMIKVTKSATSSLSIFLVHIFINENIDNFDIDCILWELVKKKTLFRFLENIAEDR